MNAIALRPHVRAAAVADDLVLLDIVADAYLCLPGQAAAWAASRDCVAATPEAAALGRALADAGLTAPVGHAVPQASLEPPRRRIAETEAAPTVRDALRLLLAYGDLLRGYRGRRFADVLAFVRRRARACGPDRGPDELARLCEVFQRLAVWLPISDKCLERSFLLLRFLQRSGHDARWRFGVRLWPFAAHCWLQSGDLALDDWPERLALYAPIHDA